MAKTVKKVRIKRSVISHSQGDVHKPLIRPPELLRQPPKLTVNGLMKLVDQGGRDRAKQVAVKEIRTIALPKAYNVLPKDTLAYRIDTYSKLNKHIHRVTIFCVEGDFDKDKKVIVDCSCSSFIYQAEVQLAEIGNAFKWRSNGMPPTVNLKKTICKHTYVALQVMLRRQKNGVLVKKSRMQKKLSFMRG